MNTSTLISIRVYFPLMYANEQTNCFIPTFVLHSNLIYHTFIHIKDTRDTSRILKSLSSNKLLEIVKGILLSQSHIPYKRLQVND